MLNKGRHLAKQVAKSPEGHTEVLEVAYKYLMFAFLMYLGDMLLLLHTQVQEDVVEEELNT